MKDAHEDDCYVSQSHWGMFQVRKYPKHVKHEPEVDRAIAAKKQYEKLSFAKFTRIFDIKA